MCQVLIWVFATTMTLCGVWITRAQDCHIEGACDWTIKSGFVVEDYKAVANRELITKHRELQRKKGNFLICLPPSEHKCELQSDWIELKTSARDVCLTALAFQGTQGATGRPAGPAVGSKNLGFIEMTLAGADSDHKSEKTDTATMAKETWNRLSARFSGPLGKHRLQINVALTDNQTFIIFDDVKVDDCSHVSCDSSDDFMCDKSTCVKWDGVCNFEDDCHNGKDEAPSLCGGMPHGAMCSFENGLCGWSNSLPDWNEDIDWSLHRGPSPTDGTGPSRDHTLGTEIGHYLYIETSNRQGLESATLSSVVLPPTGDNTCQLRFFYHMHGRNIGKLEVRAFELCGVHRNRSLWEVREAQGDKWLYAEVDVTGVTNWYRLYIEGHVGVLNHGDIAIDDVSLSPECFGLEHNRTHFLTATFTNKAKPFGDFIKNRRDLCRQTPPIKPRTRRPIRVDNLPVSTEPITSVREVHSSQQQQPFNMGIGYIVTITLAGILLIFGTALVCFGIRKRRGRSRQSGRRLEMGSQGSGGDDNCGQMPVQASAIDMQIRCAVTELNPNYDFITAKYPEQQLREIPRQSLTLTRLLGQGAFGEVYEGVLKNLCANVMELPVAVKTLPALSTEQAETDFLMEAVIISKFMHKNVVKCLGVCFEDHPRYIVLELLQGGDLRSFLRDSRPKATHPCLITMEDLVKLALDVANGCRHLEEKHFVHRDIAARNCLLTTRESGRIAKIADFGMSRDIYSADYYRKDGKAMLPIKWMPPEAFLDGVFTSKTDVWYFAVNIGKNTALYQEALLTHSALRSFGILLWEIYTLGYMPYPGQTNSDVMHFVASGGRLDPPQNCPARLNKIMLMCWNSVADIRPAFSEIIDHLDMCLQDPEVMDCDLSVCHYPLAECLKDVSVLVKSVTADTNTSVEADNSAPPPGDATAAYGGHVASESREPLLPSPDENC